MEMLTTHNRSKSIKADPGGNQNIFLFELWKPGACMNYTAPGFEDKPLFAEGVARTSFGA
jgi:hypothetical protein